MTLDLADTELVDLSIGIEPDAPSEPFPGHVEYHSHGDGAARLAENLHVRGVDVLDAADFPDGIGLAWEEVHAITHTGTHLDAPWHYGPESGGEPARTIEEADDYIAGYTVFDDFSARDTQMTEMQGRLGPAKGKNFANALGSYLTTTDAIDIGEARMTATVDGEVWSEGTPGHMEHSFADIVAYISQSETLHPGDIVGSGTVGEGCGLELGQFPEFGDIIGLTVEGIGTLENRIAPR
jgi:hypothetical protein